MSGFTDLDCKTPGVNLYGVFPCPKCKSEYRYPTQDIHPTHPSHVLCDDCGFVEPIEFPAESSERPAK